MIVIYRRAAWHIQSGGRGCCLHAKQRFARLAMLGCTEWNGSCMLSLIVVV